VLWDRSLACKALFGRLDIVFGVGRQLCCYTQLVSVYMGVYAVFLTERSMTYGSNRITRYYSFAVIARSSY
jgi:hypothetical protein